ncbi:Leucine Rich Repeat family protein [Trichomonas vaginalis G3]|uniref:Leucine Rich Repeat family protein n=1 Tax=Trichomonas vaginalis (strain ATCC PRA-98 / G3) TaxID=412133 RepID=A2DFN0_TRIV3|nr:uncharacterized protein TVAGG3_0323810 [Trichomonas vaginalis G3]EAY20733.1 Leucine Rich Repeat family protein [Trichomonas vaginalis G3]KAI5529492.1 barbed-end actin filament uncapping [Trichomonas vaginalis G3]|eukprot:XP_001581719.1 hypothetical protein [Trichomonas vaginalis G3]
MSLYGFDPLVEDNTFSDKETHDITSSLPEIEIPLHLLFRSQIRWNAKLIANTAVALSPHFINLYQQRKKGDAFKLYCSIFIGDVTLLGYTEEKYVLVQSNTQNIIFYATQGLKFAQLLYRNYQLSFSALMDKNLLTLKCPDISLFPRLDLPLSPSQQFQLTYLAACVKLGVPYNHQVVRYVHTMLLSQNTIIDIAQLPIDYSKPQEQSSIIKPMFTTLGEMNFLSGICCSDTKKPNLIDLMTEFIKLGTNFRIVHFNNCGINSGFTNLSRNARSNSDFNVNYWDLSGNNQIHDIQAFPEILSYNQSPVFLLNLSRMNIPPKVAASIFEVMARNDNFYGVRHLFLQGFPFQDQTVQKNITTFLENANKDSRLELQTLDLSKCGPGMDATLRAFCSYKTQLKTLLLNDNNITPSAFEVICFALRTFNTIEKLDISGTNLTKSNLATIIQTISENVNITKFRIIMDRMAISSDGLLPILRAFLSSRREKWIEISLNGNNMTFDDVEPLQALVKKMHNLEAISLSNNFTEKMKGVGELLGRFFLNGHLKKLTIEGTNEKKLGHELLPLLQAASQCQQLESLDISGNCGKNEIIPLLSAIVSQCKNLKSLKMDGNQINQFEQMDQLITSIKENESVISFSYPVLDAKQFVDSKKQKDQKMLISQISNQQVEAGTHINCHRLALKMPSELPFEANEDVQDLIQEITRDETRHVRGRKLMIHYMACEEMHVPLPFQAEHLSEPENVLLLQNTEKIKVYETPSLEKYVEEDKDNYKGIPFTTMNPDFNTLFANENSSENEQKQKESEVKQSEVVATKERAIFLFNEEEAEKHEDEEEKKPKKKAPPLKKKQIKDNDDDEDYKNIKRRVDDDSEDDFEIKTRRISKKELQRILPIDAEISDSSDDYDDNYVDPSEKAPKFVRKSIEDDDEEPPMPVKKSKPSKPSKASLKLSESSSAPEKPKPKPVKKLSIGTPQVEINRIRVESESETEEEEEEEIPLPPSPLKMKNPAPPISPPPVEVPKIQKKKFQFSDSDDYNQSPPSPPAEVKPLMQPKPKPNKMRPPPMHENPFKKPSPQKKQPVKPKKLEINDSSDDDIDVPPPPHIREIVKNGNKGPSPSKIPVYNRNQFQFSDSDE